MAEALKAMYTEEFLSQFGQKVQAVDHSFAAERFVKAVMDGSWEQLELKARMRRITETLQSYLPQGYEAALEVLFAIDQTCVGFPYLFFPDFVAVYGLEERHWELSLQALERFTEKSSSEFAVRPFLLRNPQRTIGRMLKWAESPNEHVRRLASEGCRPRLPWGVSLPMFKQDPTPVLTVLEALKADPSLYVRKSVANNLNDIAKDHPDRVLATARRWQGADPRTDWIVRQGCRTLIRQANPEALELFGYAKATDGEKLVSGAFLSVSPARLRIDESCELHYELTICQEEAVHVRIEYGIDFVKARGQTSRKLFLLADKTVPGGTRLSGARTHSWADLTTRRHYPGEHRLVLIVNGQEVARAVLQLAGEE